MSRSRRPRGLAMILFGSMLASTVLLSGCAIPPIITQLLQSLGGGAATPAAGASPAAATPPALGGLPALPALPAPAANIRPAILGDDADARSKAAIDATVPIGQSRP